MCVKRFVSRIKFVYTIDPGILNSPFISIFGSGARRQIDFMDMNPQQLPHLHVVLDTVHTKAAVKQMLMKN